MYRKTAVFLSPVAPVFDANVYAQVTPLMAKLGYRPLTIDTLGPLENGLIGTKTLIKQLAKHVFSLSPELIFGYAFGGTMAREVAVHFRTNVPVVTASAPLIISSRLQRHLLQIIDITQEKGLGAGLGALDTLVGTRTEVKTHALCQAAQRRFITGLTRAAHYIPTVEALALVPRCLNIVGALSSLVRREDAEAPGELLVEIADAPMRVFADHVEQMHDEIVTCLAQFPGKK